MHHESVLSCICSSCLPPFFHACQSSKFDFQQNQSKINGPHLRIMWHSYFDVETAGGFFVSSTSKPHFCLISLLNCFIFSPGENLNNNWERSFLSHLKLEEGYRKFSDKSSPNSKNSVTQATVVRKIFTKMVRTPVWVSSCWPNRESTSTVLVVFPCLFWCFTQFSMLVMPPS